MSENHGKFCWYDVMSSDTEAAGTFYRSVFGWTMQDSGLTDRSYTLLFQGSERVGGLMPIPDSARAEGARPVWFGYLWSDDVDADAARTTATGGALHHGPEDIPGAGRFAVMSDPQGAMFILFHGTGMPAPVQVAQGTPGHVGWHELQTGPLDSGFGFYADMFGWTRTETMDMGPMGTYQMFATGGPTVGGMMTKRPEVPVSFWLYYFNVAALDAATTRVTEGGGQVLNGPMQVPGGSWIAQCQDPQGAMFGPGGADALKPISGHARGADEAGAASRASTSMVSDVRKMSDTRPREKAELH